MARNFLALPFAPYKGAYSSKAFNTSRGKGLMVGVSIPWAIYRANGQALGTLNPNFNVNINLNTAGPNTVSINWYVQSVYIDNEAVNFPVYIFFPSTQFTASIPANTAGWLQVFTLDRNAIISAIGMNDDAIASAPVTNVFFTDAPMVPYLNQELPGAMALLVGSNSTLRASAFAQQQGFGPEVLGDQFTTYLLPATAAQSITITEFSNLAQPNYVYVKNIRVWAIGLVNNVPVVMTVQIAGNAQTQFWTWSMNVANTVANVPSTLVGEFDGNVKFRTNQQWVVRNDIPLTGGGVEIQITYSINIV